MVHHTFLKPSARPDEAKFGMLRFQSYKLATKFFMIRIITKIMPKQEKKKWWDEKWYWAFYVISAPFWVFLVDYLISGSIHLARDIPIAVMLPTGVLVAYYVRYHARSAT